MNEPDIDPVPTQFLAVRGRVLYSPHIHRVPRARDELAVVIASTLPWVMAAEHWRGRLTHPLANCRNVASQRGGRSRRGSCTRLFINQLEYLFQAVDLAIGLIEMVAVGDIGRYAQQWYSAKQAS
jgi:hypothetical protein